MGELTLVITTEVVDVVLLKFAVIDQELSLFKEGFVLRFEHFELFEGVIADFFQFLFVLDLDFVLDVLPIIIGQFFLIIEDIDELPLWNCVRSLSNGFHGNFGDVWTSVLETLPVIETGLNDLWLLQLEISLNWLNVLKVLLLNWVLLILHWWWS